MSPFGEPLETATVLVNRRRYDRVPLFCPARLQGPTGNPVAQGHCVDISLGGCCIVSTRAVPTGHVVRSFFSLNVSGSTCVESAIGRVVRCRLEGEGWTLGIEFLAPLDEENVPHLAARIRSA